jgi:hypothetical protein
MIRILLFIVAFTAIYTSQTFSWLGTPNNVIQNLFTQKSKKSTTKVDELKQSGWYNNVLQDIEQGEYKFNREEKGNAYYTSNRCQNLHFFYNKEGFCAEPLITRLPIDEIDNHKHNPNWKIQFNLDKKQIRNGKWEIEGNKAEYITGNITVQYINNKEGMRQNFIVRKPLENADQLKINFNINTRLNTCLNGDQIQFFHNRAGNVLNYGQLKVWDANGKHLDALIKKNNKNKFCIEVNTKNALYPIMIDPISTTPAAILDNNQSNSLMGCAVASAGDVNGDGYSDVIVGARQYIYGTYPQTGEGAVFLFLGSANGVSSTPAAMLKSNMIGDQFGFSVSSAGDVNRDGFSDVIIGAPYYKNGQDDEGAFFIYHGSSAGINMIPAAIVESNLPGAPQLGYSVSCAGDVNKDGFSDAPNYDKNGLESVGAAFIYHGSANGIITTAAARVETNQWAAQLGFSVAGAGDVNGDGYSDIITGAPGFDNGQTDEGAAFVYFGSANGIITSSPVMLECNQAGAELGFSVATAGDINSDHLSDVVISAMLYSNGQYEEGAVFIFYGKPGSISTIPATIIESNQTISAFGHSVASAGDVNGDGFIDIIVGAPAYKDAQSIGGAVFLYFGSPTGINISTPLIFKDNPDNGNLGFSVASAGDVNKDGVSDIIAGAIFYAHGQFAEGAAFVYHGFGESSNISMGGIIIFPNPTTNEIKLRLKKLYNSMNAQVYNSLGQLVKKINNLSASNLTITIPVSNLAAGNYWLCFQGDFEKHIFQFVKQ